MNNGYDATVIMWTTPTLKCTIPKEIECDYLVFSLKTSNRRINKTVMANDIEDGVFLVTFTQKETGSLKDGDIAKAQVNIFKGKRRLGTFKRNLVVESNLLDEEVS